MKRRDFLKILGITAATPVVGDVIVPEEVVFPSPTDDWGEVIGSSVNTSLKKGEIHFKGIGTYPIGDHFTLSEHRGIMEYHSLTGDAIMKPAARGAKAEVRLHMSSKEMKVFSNHFDKFNKLEVDFMVDGLLVSAKDVVIDSISVVHEMDAPLALDMTLYLQTEKVTMKEV